MNILDVTNKDRKYFEFLKDLKETAQSGKYFTLSEVINRHKPINPWVSVVCNKLLLNNHGSKSKPEYEWAGGDVTFKMARGLYEEAVKADKANQEKWKKKNDKPQADLFTAPAIKEMQIVHKEGNEIYFMDGDKLKVLTVNNK